MNQALLTEYNMDNELYDFCSMFTSMVKGGLDKQTRDNIGISRTVYAKKYSFSSSVC